MNDYLLFTKQRYRKRINELKKRKRQTKLIIVIITNLLSRYDGGAVQLFGTGQRAVMLCDREGNHRSGVALAMRHRL